MNIFNIFYILKYIEQFVFKNFVFKKYFEEDKYQT